MTRFREAIQLTSTFLSASVATETGLPLLQRLHNIIPSSWNSPKDSLSQQSEVVLYSLDLLTTIDAAAVIETSQLGIKDWRQSNALIEIIVVLGLYKVLSPGTGVPENKRIKSVLLAQEGQRDNFSDEERKYLLENITSRLKAIVDHGGELGDNLRQKHLVDILSGMVELSFNPSFLEAERLYWNQQYEILLSQYFSCCLC